MESLRAAGDAGLVVGSRSSSLARPSVSSSSELVMVSGGWLGFHATGRLTAWRRLHLVAIYLPCLRQKRGQMCHPMIMWLLSYPAITGGARGQPAMEEEMEACMKGLIQKLPWKMGMMNNSALSQRLQSLVTFRALLR